MQCFSSYYCLPQYRNEPKYENTSMILVTPVYSEDFSDNYHSAAADEEYRLDFVDCKIFTETKCNKKTVIIISFTFSAQDEDSSVRDPSYFPSSGRACEIGVPLSCTKNEVCKSISPASRRSRNGICQCKSGYYRNETGFCILKM